MEGEGREEGEEQGGGAWWRLYEWSKAWCLGVLLGKRWCWRPGWPTGQWINWLWAGPMEVDEVKEEEEEEGGEWRAGCSCYCRFLSNFDLKTEKIWPWTERCRVTWGFAEWAGLRSQTPYRSYRPPPPRVLPTASPTSTRGGGAELSR